MPVWIKPNAGLPQFIAGAAEYDITPQEFSFFVPGLVAAGATFLGGCCGAGPSFINAVREKLRSLRSPESLTRH
jgi:5-methyltetrahydrofolate--homocysteine methyltransferase